MTNISLYLIFDKIWNLEKCPLNIKNWQYFLFLFFSLYKNTFFWILFFNSSRKRKGNLVTQIENIRNTWNFSLLLLVIGIHSHHLTEENKKNKTYRSSRSEVFCKYGVLKDFAKFTGTHLYWSLFLIKLQRES